jgi:hypothetical protein
MSTNNIDNFTSDLPLDSIPNGAILREYNIKLIRRTGKINLSRPDFAFTILVSNSPTDKNEKSIIFGSGTNWAKTLTNLREKCELKKLQKELIDVLERCFIDNAGWVVGLPAKNNIDSNQQQQQTSESEQTRKEYVDESLAEEQQEVNVPDATRVTYGNIITTGIIITMGEPYQLVRQAKWKCIDCNRVLDRKIPSLIEPVKPLLFEKDGCPFCMSSFNPVSCHDYISARNIKLQFEDITSEDALDLLDVIALGDNSKSIRIG